jgi:hypothetical protein
MPDKCVDRVGVDERTLLHDIQCKYSLGGFNIKFLKTTECEVGVQGRVVASMCQAVNCHSEVDYELGVQLLQCPGLLV